MIAAITFIVAGVLAWLHYATLGPRVGFGFTVWTAWFFAVLIASAVDCYRARDRQLWMAWIVMAAGWLASMLAWKISSQPLVDLTLKNLAIMAALLMVALRPETALSAGLHGCVVLTAFMAASGVLPSAGQRPRAFLAWSYPDIAAALQHASLIIVGGYGAARTAVLDWRNRSRFVAAATGLHRVARSQVPHG